MLQTILNLLGKFGNVMDLPGSSVRDLITGNNPFDQWMTPTEDVNRVSGRDVLSQFGLMRPNHETGMSGWLSDPGEGLRDIGGALFEGLLDPTNLLPTNWVGKVLKSRKATAAANAAIGGKYGYVNPKVVARPAAEVVSEVASSPMKLLGYTPPRKEVHHGGHFWGNISDEYPHGKPILNSGRVGENGQMFGPGLYAAESPAVAPRYREFAEDSIWRQPETVREAYKPGTRITLGNQQTGTILDLDPGTDRVNVKLDSGEMTYVYTNDVFTRGALGESYARDKTATYTLDMPDGTFENLFNHNSPGGGLRLSGVKDHPVVADIKAGSPEYLKQRRELAAQVSEARTKQYPLERIVRMDDTGRTHIHEIVSAAPSVREYDRLRKQLDRLDNTHSGAKYEMDRHTASPWLRLTARADPQNTSLADVEHLISSGISGAKNKSHADPGTWNMNIWDQNVLDQMRVRAVNGERVPLSYMLPVQPQEVPRLQAGLESPLAPTMAQRQIPLSLRSPLAAGFMYNMLARQRGEL